MSILQFRLIFFRPETFLTYTYINKSFHSKILLRTVHGINCYPITCYYLVLSFAAAAAADDDDDDDDDGVVAQIVYRRKKPVSPAIYLIQVLNLSPDVADGSSYLVPQALVNVLPKNQDAHVG